MLSKKAKVFSLAFSVFFLGFGQVLIQGFLADGRQIGRIGYVISHVPFAVLRVGRDILPYG